MATKKKKKLDPIKQREKRAKIAALAGGVLLLGVAAIEVPVGDEAAEQEAGAGGDRAGCATPNPGGLAFPQVGATATGTTSSSGLADTDVPPPALSVGQLVTFNAFEMKNPFKPQVSSAPGADRIPRTRAARRRLRQLPRRRRRPRSPCRPASRCCAPRRSTSCNDHDHGHHPHRDDADDHDHHARACGRLDGDDLRQRQRLAGRHGRDLPDRSSGLQARLMAPRLGPDRDRRRLVRDRRADPDLARPPPGDPSEHEQRQAVQAHPRVDPVKDGPGLSIRRKTHGGIRIYGDQRSGLRSDGEIQRPRRTLRASSCASAACSPSTSRSCRRPATTAPRTAFKKIKPKSLQIFSRQFATMIEAGLNVVGALVILEEQTDDKYLAA